MIKNSRTQVKSRIIPPEIIEKYNAKAEALEADIKDILKQEKEEKEVNIETHKEKTTTNKQATN